MSMIQAEDGGMKVVSMSDVIRHPLYAVLSNQTLTIPYGKGKFKQIDGIDAMLWTMGLDIFFPVESEILQHRSELSNEIVTCERFVGSKRQDQAWKDIEELLRII